MKKVFSLDQSTNLFYHNNGRMKSQILLGHVDVVVKKGETNFRCCCFYDFTWILWFTQMFLLKSSISWITLFQTLMINTYTNIWWWLFTQTITEITLLAKIDVSQKNRSTTFFFSQWNINSRELLLESQRINFDFCTQ